LVAVGGALGTLARYGVSQLAGGWQAPAWPWATFAVNLAGSLALGWLYGWTGRRASPASARQRLFLGTGLLGAFTTYSAFSIEVVTLFTSDAVGLASAYALTSVVAGLGAAWLGLAWGRRQAGAGGAAAAETAGAGPAGSTAPVGPASLVPPNPATGPAETSGGAP
jgi:CrcB protein